MIDPTDFSQASGIVQTRLSDFGMTHWSEPPIDIKKLLEPFRSGSELPVSYYEDRCSRCGHQLSGFGIRENNIEVRKKRYCPQCKKFTTLGFNCGAHVPVWVYSRVLFSTALGHKNVDIQKEVKLASRDKGPPSRISVPTINRIRNSSLNIFNKFEPLLLRYLTTKSVRGTWCMDDRYHDLPFDPSLFPEKVLDPRKGNPHMYPTIVIHEKTGFCFSALVSKHHDKRIAMHALFLAMDRTGTRPAPLKIDYAKGLYAGALSLLSPEEILRINKEQDFAFNNSVERWFSDYGQRHNKHHCQYKRPWTQEPSLNIYRWYRNCIWPYKKTGKTPAESLGLALPRNINNEIDFIPLLDFAYHLTNFVQSEIALARSKTRRL